MNKVLFCLSLALSLVLSSHAQEEPSAAAQQTAPAQKLERPNILVMIADDWSFGHAGAYGSTWVNTPNFDRVAKEGILFTRAYTPNPKCAPSRAILLTGRHSWQLEEAGNHWCHFPAKFGSYPERLSAAGYVAGFTGKGWGPGFANDEQGNPRQMTGKAFQEKQGKAPTSKITSIDYAANFADFLKQVPADQPWVFWCGVREPHRAYEFQSGVRLGKKLSDIDRVPGYWPDTPTTRHDMLDYAIEVEHFDKHLGRVLEYLEQAGQRENTLLIVTSDHGMPFPRVKGQNYNDSAQVPLAISWPKGITKPGRKFTEFVDFTDLAPTFLAVAGIEDPAPIMQPPTGKSLEDIFADNYAEGTRDFVLLGKERHDVGRPDDQGYPMRAIRQENWLYIRNYEPTRWPSGNPETGYMNADASPTKTLILEQRRTGKELKYWKMNFGKRPEEELYDVQKDPDCVNNLAAAEQHQERKQQLRSKMETELKKQGDPRSFGQGEIFDNYPFANEKLRDFYNRYQKGEDLPSGWINQSDFEKQALP